MINRGCTPFLEQLDWFIGKSEDYRSIDADVWGTRALKGNPGSAVVGYHELYYLRHKVVAVATCDRGTTALAALT